MKCNWISKNVWLVAITFGVFVLHFTSSHLCAQQASNALAANASYDMLNIEVGVTATREIVVKNESSQDVTLSSSSLVCGTVNFKFVNKVVYPLVIGAGETLVLGTVSYTPSRANEDYVGYLMIAHSPKLRSEAGEVRLHGTSVVDSALLIPCLSGSFDSVVFGPVVYNGSVTRTLYVKNNRDEPKVLRCIDFTIGDHEAFVGVDNEFPMTIPPHETREIKIAFKPTVVKSDSSDMFMSSVLLEPMDPSDACSPDFQLNGIAVKTDNREMKVLLDDTTRVLAMSSPELLSMHDFSLQNTGTEILTITNGVLESGMRGIGFVTFLPQQQQTVTVKPGETVTFRLGYCAPNYDVQYDKLTFASNLGKSFTYHIQAIRTPTTSVKNTIAAEQSTISISPNPAIGDVAITVGNGFHGNIEIYSIDGKMIASERNVNSFIWKATQSKENRISNQEYIVRAIGRTGDGQPITTSAKAIILAH